MAEDGRLGAGIEQASVEDDFVEVLITKRISGDNE
jgi:hypothetical protein